MKLNNKVIIITGATRGIGREIALRAAQDGANIVILGKTTEPHPTLEGTIYSVAEEVTAAGGVALPLYLDVRDEENIHDAIAKVVDRFGQIDILVNNASAIFLASTLEMSAKRYDLLSAVNARGTFLCSKACIPHLKNASNPHILNLSPPLNMQAKWFKNHLAYTLSKYGMSMCTLGMAEEFKSVGIAVNSLWPKTTIATAAIAVNFPKQIYQASRQPAIVANAAYAILTSSSRDNTGNFYIDEEVLRAQGETDFDQYAVSIGTKLCPDFYLD